MINRTEIEKNAIAVPIGLPIEYKGVAYVKKTVQLVKDQVERTETALAEAKVYRAEAARFRAESQTAKTEAQNAAATATAAATAAQAAQAASEAAQSAAASSAADAEVSQQTAKQEADKAALSAQMAASYVADCEPWDASKPYSPPSVVMMPNGDTYRCLRDNTGEYPITSNAWAMTTVTETLTFDYDEIDGGLMPKILPRPSGYWEIGADGGIMPRG